MRNAFIRELSEIAARDSRVVLLTGDMGFSVVEKFAERHPQRFFNVGVAEQNMVGMATGLAEAGFIPFVYSIATFAAIRPYEFIRNGPGFQHLPVRIVGTGGAFDYGTAGPSHHAMEDLGLMRLQPGITVACPADSQQAVSALRATWDLPNAVYLRLGKDEEASVPGLAGRFRLGSAEVVAEGSDLLIITTGSIAIDAARSAQVLAASGISCCVLVVAALHPAPLEDLAEALGRHCVALTVENHYVTGGLGSAVAEIIAERGIRCRLTRCGVTRPPDGRSGSEQWLLRQNGLGVEDLVKTARKALGAACLN